MKDEKVWNFTECQIGHPCAQCINTCSFKIKPTALKKGQDEKEKIYERITKKSKRKQ